MKAKEPVSHTLLKKHLEELGLAYETEVQVCLDRKYRWDFTLPEHRIAIEVCGGFYRGQSGHSSITGLQRDYDKRNVGTMLGWRILTFSTADVLRGRAKKFIQENVGKG